MKSHPLPSEGIAWAGSKPPPLSCCSRCRHRTSATGQAEPLAAFLVHSAPSCKCISSPSVSPSTSQLKRASSEDTLTKPGGAAASGAIRPKKTSPSGAISELTESRLRGNPGRRGPGGGDPGQRRTQIRRTQAGGTQSGGPRRWGQARGGRSEGPGFACPPEASEGSLYPFPHQMCIVHLLWAGIPQGRLSSPQSL